ncbi:hypothetical protein [Roseovarius pelagicus]|uniref:Uncharacterized protein n=1 Tax=Roseovarius pelagicus TaxID=2980108 RepID=A0ABY6DB68_9RHOB|nr:hypothetical protein [Roseovarius pelagicus]UXX82273.1 hypothetical protein N7U68_14345 [Roseovarius pelagicus]
MEMIADILLVAGALGAGLYCYILARRLSRFNDLENGVGGAVAILSAQVDDLTKTLEAAQGTAGASTESLETLTDRAEGVARRLELMVASMHDLPGNQFPAQGHEMSADTGASGDQKRAVAPAPGPIFRRREHAGVV